MEEKIHGEIEFLSKNGKLQETKLFTQHGNYSVYKHCVNVTEMIDETSLIEGALLHDYFLYDWHEADNWHRLHGFTHPYIALAMAERDYALTAHLNLAERARGFSPHSFADGLITSVETSL